jgi:chromosomal replication initiator protein
MQKRYVYGLKMITEIELQKFQNYKNALRGKYGNAAYDSWFKPLSLMKLQNGHAVIGAPSSFSASQITQRYSSGMIEVWHKEMGPLSQLSIKGCQKLSEHAQSTAQNAPQAPAYSAPAKPQIVKPLVTKAVRQPKPPTPAVSDAASPSFTNAMAAPLSAKLTFDTFCQGEANRVAYAAAHSVLEDEERLVFLYGASGRGKTHLLNAIGQEWLQRLPDDKVLYLTYDALLNGYVSAVLSKSVPELRAYLDQIDILLVDDIHLLRGRKATQEELLCLVDRLMSRGKTVVIAGELAPTKLAETGLNQRFADRLGGGLSVQIDKPDAALRLTILKQMAAQDEAAGKASLPEEVLRTISRRCDASVRELVGAYRLVRLNLQTDLKEGKIDSITEERTKALLQQHLRFRQKEVTLEEIKAGVAEAFGLSVADIESRRRMQHIVKARHAFCLLARRLTDTPLKQIGAVINRDHTTVLSSIDRGEVLAETNPAFGDRISALMEEFAQ